jgi:flagellar biosynthesis/type III secretory pathway M-ring protein FliF/YscJ
MEYLIGAILVFLAASPVVVPLLRPSEDATPELEGAEVQELLAEKQTLYAAIKELEFDHQAGKLSLEDYQQTRRSYELRAVALLEQIDRLGEGSAGDGAGRRRGSG